MPRFHWNSELEYQDLDQRAQEYNKREAIRQTIGDDWGDRAADIRTMYPWLSAGVIAALTKAGLDAQHPDAKQVADLEFQRRTAQGDWDTPGQPVRVQGKHPSTTRLFGGGVKNAAEEAQGPTGEVAAPVAVPGESQGVADQVPGQSPGTQI